MQQVTPERERQREREIPLERERHGTEQQHCAIDGGLLAEYVLGEANSFDAIDKNCICVNTEQLNEQRMQCNGIHVTRNLVVGNGTGQESVQGRKGSGKHRRI